MKKQGRKLPGLLNNNLKVIMVITKFSYENVLGYVDACIHTKIYLCMLALTT